MWLLNTETHALEFFNDDRSLVYAILSHRWTDDEVSFEDIQSGKDVTNKQGWAKIMGACRTALEDDLAYIWIDTCCIDKTSSAELSEAINSMYRWYKNSYVCYAYLSDVAIHGPKVSDDDLDQLLSSKWHLRGWTLQELIAPPDFVFFDCNWVGVSDRAHHNLIDRLSAKTGIPVPVLSQRRGPQQYSIAQRMSWAAKRTTTRGEDMAYSLMGLFDVNMPMLYGEGSARAFIRLQEEIVKHSPDQTIFAWPIHRASEPHGLSFGYHELLAHSPADFAECQSIIPSGQRRPVAFQQSNLGLQITLPIRVYSLDIYQAVLDVVDTSHTPPKALSIYLACHGEHPFTDILGRIADRGDDLPLQSMIATFKLTSFERELHIPRNPFSGKASVEGLFGFQINEFKIVRGQSNLTLHNGIDVIARKGTWNVEASKVALETGTVGTAIGFAIRDRYGKEWVFLKLGFDKDFAPWSWTASLVHWVGSFEQLIPPMDLNRARDFINTEPSFYEAPKFTPTAPPVTQHVSNFDVLHPDLTSSLETNETSFTAQPTVPPPAYKNNDLSGFHRGTRVYGLKVHTPLYRLRIKRQLSTNTWHVDFELTLPNVTEQKPVEIHQKEVKAKSRLFHRPLEMHKR